MKLSLAFGLPAWDRNPGLPISRTVDFRNEAAVLYPIDGKVLTVDAFHEIVYGTETKASRRYVLHLDA